MKKFFDVEICEVINGEPVNGNDIWDSDALFEPFEGETEEDAIEDAVSVEEDLILENGSFASEDKDGDIKVEHRYCCCTKWFSPEDVENMSYWEKRDIIMYDTIEKMSRRIKWKDLNGEEHTILFRAKEREMEEIS